MVKEFSTTAVLTSGSVERALFNMTMPMILGLVSIFSYNLADTWFVSKLGTDALASMGFTFPVAFLFHSIATGLGIGISSLISQTIGRGNYNLTKRFTVDGLLLGVVIVLVLAPLGILTINDLFAFLGAEERLMPLINDYMFYWYLGSVFLIVPMIGNNAIRATGDAKTPCIIMTISAIINVILDPIMIFGFWIFPAMGIKGAAIATVIGQATMLFTSFYILACKKRMISYEIPTMKQIFNSWKEILHVGFPATVTQLMNPICNAIYTKMIATFGVVAVAAFGASTRIEAFAVLPLISLTTSIPPVVGQNWGAGNYERTHLGIKRACQFSILWGIFCYAFFFLFSGKIAEGFTNDQEVQKNIITFFYIMPLCYAFIGIFMVVTMAFNAMGEPKKSTVLNFVRLFCFLIPFAFIGSKIYGYAGLFLGTIVANILSGVLSFKLIKNNQKKICAKKAS